MGRHGLSSRQNTRVVRALPREPVIEYQHVIGSPLPFANQPGSGLQLATRAYQRRSALFELLGKLPLWAQTAESQFLHPVCDGSQQQLTAEVRRSLGERATADEARRDRARGGARAPPGKPLHLGLRGSCPLRCGDAVDPASLRLARRADEGRRYISVGPPGGSRRRAQQAATCSNRALARLDGMACRAEEKG